MKNADIYVNGFRYATIPADQAEGFIDNNFRASYPRTSVEPWRASYDKYIIEVKVPELLE